MKKNKRQELEKDCERFGITDILWKYKSKLQSNKTPKIHHLAWVVYSDYLLLSKSSKGKCVCITCWKVDDWYSSDMHPWHYREAWTSLKRKFVDDNVRPQCVWCNVMKNGNYKMYTFAMIEKFWFEWCYMITTDKDTHTIKNWQYGDMIKEWYQFIIKHNKWKR